MMIFWKVMGKPSCIRVFLVVIKIRNSDIETIVNYLKKVQNESPGFYYTMRMDEEKHSEKHILDRC